MEVNFDGAFQRFFPDIEEVCRRVCRRQSRLRRQIQLMARDYDLAAHG